MAPLGVALFDLQLDDRDVEHDPAERIGGHAGAGAAFAVQKARGGEFPHGAVHGATGTAEFAGQINLVRDRHTGGPLLFVDPAQKFRMNLAPRIDVGVDHILSIRDAAVFR